MNNRTAINIMKAEMECIKRADSCGRECAECDLVMDDKELLAAYELAIDALAAPAHSDISEMTDDTICVMFCHPAIAKKVLEGERADEIAYSMVASPIVPEDKVILAPRDEFTLLLARGVEMETRKK